MKIPLLLEFDVGQKTSGFSTKKQTKSKSNFIVRQNLKIFRSYQKAPMLYKYIFIWACHHILELYLFFKIDPIFQLIYCPIDFRSAKTIHSKWTRHEAFRSEIASNKERLEKVTECGNTLLQSKPEMAEMIGPKLSELGTEFVTLEEKTEEKGERLFDR